jgi:hypothetical protein
MVLDPSPSRIIAQPSRLPSSPPVPEKTFKRLRSSLEQSIRSATRSRASRSPPIDGAAISPPSQNKGKDRVPVESDVRSKSRILKVAFRRSGQDSVSAEPRSNRKHNDPENIPGIPTNFSSPSLRQASLSSPALHLYSDAVPGPKVQAANLVPSGSNGSNLRSSSGNNQKPIGQSGVGEKDLSSSVSPPPRSSFSQTPREASRQPKPPKHRPPPLLSKSQSTVSLEATRGKNAFVPQTPTPKYRDKFHVPDSPPPRSDRRSGGLYAAASSTSQLNIDAPTSSPPPGAVRHARARSPSVRHHLSSSSSSNLPSASLTGDVKRSSLESTKPRRPSFDGRRVSGSPSTPSSAQIRPRAVSPSPRSFSPNYPRDKHFNASTTSLSSPTSPEHRGLLRSATSILCKELLKPLGHNTTGLGTVELEEIEVRMRALARLERIWGKSGSMPSGDNATPLTSGLSSSGLSAAGEDREKRLFSDALRDGYVLCQ